MINPARNEVHAPSLAKREAVDPLIIEFPRPVSVDSEKPLYSHDTSKSDADGSLLTSKTVQVPDPDSGGGQKTMGSEIISPRTALGNCGTTAIAGQYVEGMVHDFNNMLMIVSGSLEVLQVRISQGRASDVNSHLSVARDAVQRAAAVARRLLSYSRNVADEAKSLDVNRFVVGMESMLRHAVGPDVVLLVAVADERWFSVVDPSQLESSLLNLCLNARDAMPNGGRITIESADCILDQDAACDLGLAPGRYVALRVGDDGWGMEEQALRRAFEPFSTTKAAGKGTGLGLSMVKNFVDQSAGTVRISSRPGQGTDVTIYLPTLDRRNPESSSHTLLSSKLQQSDPSIP